MAISSQDCPQEPAGFGRQINCYQNVGNYRHLPFSLIGIVAALFGFFQVFTNRFHTWTTFEAGIPVFAIFTLYNPILCQFPEGVKCSTHDQSFNVFLENVPKGKTVPEAQFYIAVHIEADFFAPTGVESVAKEK